MINLPGMLSEARGIGQLISSAPAMGKVAMGAGAAGLGYGALKSATPSYFGASGAINSYASDRDLAFDLGVRFGGLQDKSFFRNIRPTSPLQRGVHAFNEFNNIPLPGLVGATHAGAAIVGGVAGAATFRMLQQVLPYAGTYTNPAQVAKNNPFLSDQSVMGRNKSSVVPRGMTDPEQGKYIAQSLKRSHVRSMDKAVNTIDARIAGNDLLLDQYLPSAQRMEDTIRGIRRNRGGSVLDEAVRGAQMERNRILRDPLAGVKTPKTGWWRMKPGAGHASLKELKANRMSKARAAMSPAAIEGNIDSIIAGRVHKQQQLYNSLHDDTNSLRDVQRGLKRQRPIVSEARDNAWRRNAPRSNIKLQSRAMFRVKSGARRLGIGLGTAVAAVSGAAMVYNQAIDMSSKFFGTINAAIQSEYGLPPGQENRGRTSAGAGFQTWTRPSMGKRMNPNNLNSGGDLVLSMHRIRHKSTM